MMKKNLRRLSGLLFILIFTLPMYADYIEIYGKVYSVSDSAYVPGHEVIITSIEGWEDNTYTDESGAYHFSFEPGGSSDDSLFYYIYTFDNCIGDFVYEYIFTPGDHEVNFTICEHGNSDCEAYFWYYAIDNSGMTLQFYDASWGNPTHWEWNFGDGGTSQEQHPVHTYAEPGIYPVSLTISNDECTSEIIYDVWAENWNDTIWPECYADFYYYYTGDKTVQYQDLSWGNPNSWFWEFGDGNTSTAQNPSHTFENDGEYITTLTIETDSCSSSTNYRVWIGDWDDSTWYDCYADFYYYPTYDETGNYVYNSKTIQFVDNSWGNPNSWFWKFGDNFTSAEQHPIHTYPENGEYIVSLTIETDSCVSTTEYWIWVGDWNDTLYYDCQADFYYEYMNNENTLKFYDISWGNPYEWYWEFGDGTTSTQQNPIHTYASDGEYWVTLAIVGDSCESKVEWPVWVGYMDTVWIPESCFAMFYSENSFTDPLHVQFWDASWGNVFSWYWEFGDGTSSTEQNPQHIYGTEGWYEVTLQIMADSCESVFFMGIYVGDDYWGDENAVCQALFMPEIDGQTVYFHNLTNCDMEVWNWNFGDGTTGNEHSPIHVYGEIGTYVTSLTINGEYEGLGYSSSFAMEIDLATGTIKAMVGIDDLNRDFTDFEAFQLYPNPVGNEMTLDFNSISSGESMIEIMNISGQIIFRQSRRIHTGSNVMKINTGELAEGMYMVRVSSDRQISIARFVK